MLITTFRQSKVLCTFLPSVELIMSDYNMIYYLDKKMPLTTVPCTQATEYYMRPNYSPVHPLCLTDCVWYGLAIPPPEHNDNSDDSSMIADCCVRDSITS